MKLPGRCRDYTLLVARLLLGVILFAYGWEKLVTKGIDAVAAGFTKNGVPFPSLSAAFATTVELLGGAAFIVGAGTGAVGVLVALNMVGAALTTGQFHAILAEDRGIALTGSIAAGALLLATVGAGRLSLDHLLAWGFDNRTQSRPPAAAGSHRSERTR